jgi:hypothetical protein
MVFESVLVMCILISICLHGSCEDEEEEEEEEIPNNLEILQEKYEWVPVGQTLDI